VTLGKDDRERGSSVLCLAIQEQNKDLPDESERLRTEDARRLRRIKGSKKSFSERKQHQAKVRRDKREKRGKKMGGDTNP